MSLSRDAAALLLFPALALLAFAPARAAAHDYPTDGRVVYVERCMAENPGPHYEMVSKCSCALDHIAQTTPYDDFVSMQTSTDANSIAGERGNAIRDAEIFQLEIRKFRTLQAEAKKSCFIGFMQQIH
jgi:hypothetical protein